MKIAVKVTKDRAANWVEEWVEIKKPAAEWTENELHELCNKMQWFIGGNDAVRTCEKVGDRYRVAVTVDD